jgi:hypothetical protein
VYVEAFDDMWNNRALTPEETRDLLAEVLKEFPK